MGDNRSIAVFGAGAVGGYLGGRFAASPLEMEVTLLGRDTVAKAINSHGLLLCEGGTDRVTYPRAVSRAADLPPADLALLTTRAYDVAPSIPELVSYLGDDRPVLALQNGVGSEEILARSLGPSRVVAATLTVSVGREAPGTVTRFSRSGGLALASMDGASIPEWLVTLCRSTGLPTVIIADYRSLRWSKLLLNMLGAASTAILDIDMTALVSDRRLFHLEQRAFLEAGRVMDAQGIATVDLPGYPVRLARWAMRLPTSLAHRLVGSRLARSRGGRAPAMRQDVLRGRSEIDFLNGAIADSGRRCGVRTPVNDALTGLTRELMADPGKRHAFASQPDAFLQYMASHGVDL